MYLSQCSLLQFVRFVLVTSILFALLPLITFAQAPATTTATAPTTPTVTKGVILASINLANAKILNQTDDKLTIEFVLENQGSEAQFDIRYGAELIQTQEGGSQVIIDSFIPSEVLVLNAGDRTSKIVEYPISNLAPGTYSIWVSAKTTAGTMLGLGSAGQVTIATKDSLEIKANSCTLKVAGETGTFSLYQGVDIASNENLTLDCIVKNHSAEERDFVPKYETYRRTVFGEKVVMDYPNENSIKLAAFEEKNISLNIPKAKEAQSYDVTVALLDEKTEKIVSNHLVVHYVLQGVSATIQTVAFDKSSYNAGEMISLNLFWTPSADGFFESRQGEGTVITGNITAYVQVMDENNKICSEKILQVLDKSMVTLKVLAITNCVKPMATVLLIGPDGATLDSRSIAVKEIENQPSAAAEQNNENTAKNNENSLMTVSIIAFAIAFTTILFVIFRKKRVNTLV